MVNLSSPEAAPLTLDAIVGHTSSTMVCAGGEHVPRQVRRGVVIVSIGGPAVLPRVRLCAWTSASACLAVTASSITSGAPRQRMRVVLFPAQALPGGIADHCARAGRASGEDERTARPGASWRSATRRARVCYGVYSFSRPGVPTQTRRHCELRALVLWNTRRSRPPDLLVIRLLSKLSLSMTPMSERTRLRLGIASCCAEV